MIATEFIRIKRTREEVLAFLQDPCLPEKVLKILEKQFGITVGVSGVIAGQSVATAIDELLGLTSNLQYADVDLFLQAPSYNSVSTPLRSQSNLELLKCSFALKHFHAWVDRVFYNLDANRRALAKKDAIILQEFINDSSSLEYDKACASLKLLSGYHNSRRSMTSMEGLLVLENNASVSVAGYPVSFQAANDFIGTCTYRVVGIQNEGVEQKIYYHGKLHQPLPSGDYVHGQGGLGYDIISGFDLNSVSVGVDIRAIRMIYTPEYVDFLLSRQIHILQSKTPVQSVVRAMKKAQEHAGFFNSTHGMDVMRHTLLFVGTEPIGLKMPEKYEQGSIYKHYSAYRSAAISTKAPDSGSSDYIKFLNNVFEDRSQARYMIHRAFTMFGSNEPSSVVTTTSRLAPLSEQNRELLEKVVKFHSDPTGFYVFPEVINFENIQYDCLLQSSGEYMCTAGSDKAIPKHEAFSGDALTIWQNIDWGMRFKKFRPAYVQRIKKFFTPIYKYAPDDILNPNNKLYSPQESPKSYLPLVSLLYDYPIALLYSAMKGHLSEKVVKLSEMPAKAVYNTMVMRTHSLVTRQLLEHWCKLTKPITSTVEEHTEYASFIRRFVEKFKEAETVYFQAAKILDIMEHRLPRSTSIFPQLQMLWENIHDDKGRALSSRVQQYFDSGATEEGLLSFEGFTVDNASCFPFFNKMESFERALSNNIRGWPLLERFFDVWIGVGFTTLLRNASSKDAEYLKQTFVDFKDFTADGVKAEWKKQCQEKGLIITDLKVEELIRADDLVQEGIEMHHCVGGYGTHVSELRSYIIRYRATAVTLQSCPLDFVGPGAPTVHTLKATAEWCVPTVQPVGDAFKDDAPLYTYKLSQIRDVYNRAPHAELKALDKALREKGIPNRRVELDPDAPDALDVKVQKIMTHTFDENLPPDDEDLDDIPF